MDTPFDTHALIPRMRAQDEDAITEAYRITFGSDVGRQVLADILATGGVGQCYGGSGDLYGVGYHQGGHDLALEILERAGFDQASAIAAVMTNQLEGRDDEQSATPLADDDPEF